MTPETRFHATVLGLTVSLMFTVLSRLDLPTQNWIASQRVVGPIVTLFLSAGIYSSIAQGLIVLLRRIRWLKRLLLGASYLEGTWVSYTSTSSGREIWIVEHFEQDLSSLLIKGRSFFALTEKDHGKWESKASHIDVRQGQLSYYYMLDLFENPDSHSAASLQGIAIFGFQRKSAIAVPDKLHGYSSNLVNNIRVPATEYKISDAIIDPKEAIKKGRELKLDNVESA